MADKEQVLPEDSLQARSLQACQEKPLLLSQYLSNSHEWDNEDPFLLSVMLSLSLKRARHSLTMNNLCTTCFCFFQTF